MPDDFSLRGREKFLRRTFYSLRRDVDVPNLPREEIGEFEFARWTLIESVIWKFLRNKKWRGYYCHLDGFSFEGFYRYEDGFVGLGNIWHLPEPPGAPDDIPAVMAIEFCRSKSTMNRGMIWIGLSCPDVITAPAGNFKDLDSCFASRREIGDEWKLAFERSHGGWSMNPDFDLSLLLRRDDDRQRA